ncbi:MAG: HindIII family type II restriction endonuclease [Defluviitaleaceae bacterium]|nr:HindIII family type II restriction endonuclease [Defluviitaleaceae bacterium]
MFDTLILLIKEYAKDGFYTATEKLNDFIANTDDIADVLMQIGTIPESIEHDSTEEKLFSKVSDAVLSRAFRELGLKSRVITERADSADVIAESAIHNYTLVADAKAFRLSRTAKNQKDFKVGALSAWRKDSDFAVLCSPYFQYPRNQSQIYAQARDNNVCLLSWEHLVFLLRNKIKESETINLSKLWGFSNDIARTTVVAEKKKSFMREFDNWLISIVGLPEANFADLLLECIGNTVIRGTRETKYWENEREIILSYSRKQAVEELIKHKKIDEKIRQIDRCVTSSCRDLRQIDRYVRSICRD